MDKALRSRADTHPNKTSNDLKLKNNLPKQLNREQEMSIFHGLSPLMIIAGPGTGKTFTLTGRIAHLLKTDQARPSEVLAVSFTQRAAEEMKSRLSNSFNDDSIIKDLRVQTLHSFGYGFLRRFGPEIGRLDSYFIADEEKQKGILNKLLQESGREGIRLNLSEIMEKISLFRQGSLPENRLDPALISLSHRYERRLRDENLMDYDDLLLMPLRIMNEHEDILRIVQNDLKFMFVDEYQDLNPLQINLIKALAHAELHITIIGDPDQSIYGFRGVRSDHFINFTTDFPNVEVLRLKDNYRSNEIYY